jgi:thiopurine S-methyltransferase
MTDWIQRWSEGKIGWHSESINESLIKHIDCLGLSTGETVFVPLCGKSKDMIHFMQEGFKVIGVEISELGAKQFFDENCISYSVKELENFVAYYNNKISIYCGDFFNLSSSMMDSIDATYDRASLIALPADLRQKYANHLYSIIPNGSSILLLTINYPQSQMTGPPFAVNNDEVKLLYSEGFDCQLLECIDDGDIEPKFLQAGVEFFQTATYCLRKNREING